MKFLKLWLPLILSCLVVTLCSKIGFVGLLEPFAQQLIFHVRGAQPWHDELVLIKIDQASIDELGWFPWKRDRYTQLLEQVSQAENSILVFNLIFSEETLDDAALAAAMEEHGHVVLSSAWHNDRSPWFPTSTLQEAAAAVGHINQIESQDSIEVLPFLQKNPALSVVTAHISQVIQGNIFRLPHPNQPLRPNWPGPVEQIVQYSFLDVLEGTVPPTALDNKVVVVGVTAPGLDPFSTPFEPPNDSSGVHLHLALLHSLFKGNLLQSPPRYWLLLLAMVWGLATRYGLLRLPRRQQMLLLLYCFLGWPLFAAIALHSNWIFPIVWPMILSATLGINLLVAHNIQLHQINRNLQNKASIDATTRLKNRSFFNDYAAYIWRDAVREQRSLSLILCDVDHFKLYNDTYGHPAGDDCLYQVARALQSAVFRASDVVARYGGEEFIILLPSTSLDNAKPVADRVQSQLAARSIPHKSSLTDASVTLSLGVACIRPRPDVNLEMLIEGADQALYAAKKQGRNCYVLKQL